MSKIDFPMGMRPLLFCDACSAFCGPAKSTRHTGRKLCKECDVVHQRARVRLCRQRKRGAPTQPELLKEVARIYGDAYANGVPPTSSVAAIMDVPRSTAGRWVLRARRAGMLPETRMGRANASV